MTTPSSDTPPADVPEADWAEQALEADPMAAEAEGESGPRPADPSPASSGRLMTPTWPSRRSWCTAKTRTSSAKSLPLGLPCHQVVEIAADSSIRCAL